MPDIPHDDAGRPGRLLPSALQGCPRQLFPDAAALASPSPVVSPTKGVADRSGAVDMEGLTNVP